MAIDELTVVDFEIAAGEAFSEHKDVDGGFAELVVSERAAGLDEAEVFILSIGTEEPGRQTAVKTGIGDCQTP